MSLVRASERCARARRVARARARTPFSAPTRRRPSEHDHGGAFTYPDGTSAADGPRPRPTARAWWRASRLRRGALPDHSRMTTTSNAEARTALATASHHERARRAVSGERDSAAYLLVMYRRSFIGLCLSLVGVAAVHCGGTSTPPSGGVHASSSPASADETSSAADRAPGAEASAPPPAAVTDAPSADEAPTCDGKKCPDDQHCDLQSVRCVRAPCPAVPMCVEGMHPCAATTCASGSRCESHDGQAQCIPVEPAGGGVACGRATCEPGMVCCNASCGICTPPDGVCTQQACE